jgi:Tfp pilus assembly protein PilZ
MKALKIHKNIELRIEKRHSCSESIFFATQNRLYEGQLKNYSRDGLFIKTKEVLSVGEIITVVDPHPEGENKKRKGQILWRNNEGFGVELYRNRKYWKHKVIRFEKRSVNNK